MGDGTGQSTCADWLEHIQAEIARLRDHLNQGTDCFQNEINTFEIGRLATNFFMETMDAICDEVRAGRLIQARIMIRPLMEISLSLRWASITDAGWPRLYSYYDQQADKEVTSAMQALGMTVPGKDARQSQVEGETTSAPKRCARIEDRIREVWKHDHAHTECGGETKTVASANPLYDVVYRLLCGPGHANLFSVGRVEHPEQVRKVITLECALAGSFLFRAISKVLGEECSSAPIEKVIERLGG